MAKPGSVRELVDRNLNSFYGWLRRFSQGLMRHERPSHTLQATALAHEVLARLCQWDGTLSGDDDEARQRSLKLLAASIARQVLVDHARKRLRQKRSGNRDRISLSAAEGASPGLSQEILDLELALRALEEVYPEEARLVQLKFFGGATMAEAAALLGWSERTAARRWAFAKAWIQTALQAETREAADTNESGTQSSSAQSFN